jgi:hypothetical protein
MSGSTRYSPELPERAVRIVIDNRRDRPDERAGLAAISKPFNTSSETLRIGVGVALATRRRSELRSPIS